MGACHYTAYSVAPDTARQQAGVDVKAVQDLMEYACAITTLKHYVVVTDQTKQDAIERVRKAL